MSLLEITFFIFLVIFSLSALVAIASLIGLFKVEAYYKKQLFRLLILQVLGVVITFVTQQITDQKTKFITSDFLLLNDEWQSQYSEKCWKTTGHFTETDSGIEFHAMTYYLNNEKTPKETAIVNWASVEPIKIKNFADGVSFKVRQTILDAFGDIDSNMTSVVNTSKIGTLKLKADFSLRGSWMPDDHLLDWGMEFNRVLK